MKAKCSQRVVRFLSITVAGLCVLGCGPSANAPAAKPTLRVLCGSSMAAPIQEIGRQFARRQGLALEYDLGGSETLLPKILLGVPADIFVCHDPFEDKVKEEKRWSGSVVVGYLEPIIAVRPGNPKGIRVLDDLKRPDLKLGIGDPRYSTCGALFVEALERRGLRQLVMPQVILQGRTHAEIANGLILGPLDAAVVWNFVAMLYPGKLEVVPTGVAYPETRVTVVGLKQSANPAARDAFLQWCAQPEAQQTFRTFGYTRGTGPAAGTK
jgi:molybdate transport system substrate-binding protein